MEKIDIEELQFFIADELEKDEFCRRWPRYELEHPEHIEGDAYSIGVAVGVSRARYALEKFLSVSHTGVIDSILKEAGIKKPYMDGNQFCILLGEDLQSGICGFGKTKKEALIDFLKAVRLRYNQPHWKPSEKQMKALYSALNDANDAISLYSNKVFPLYEEISRKRFDTLESLYNDLKKLM